MVRARVAVAVAAACLGTVALAACGTGDDATPSPTPTLPPTTTPTPEAVVPVWPLTGLPVAAAEGDPAMMPVLVVKIDNTAAAEPQVGLSAADLVVEQLVEGGLTRLAAMYHSTLPERVEPVRSVRGTDIGIVGPTGGALVGSGGAGRVLDDMADAGLTVLTNDAGDPGFSRDSGRSAPYNVVLDPAAAQSAALDKGLAAPDVFYLPWAGSREKNAETAEPVTTVTATFSRAHTSQWTWGGDAWQLDGDLAGGEPFEPATLLVLRVATRDAGYRDPGGNPVPETVLAGTGEAIVITGDGAVHGTWSKDGVTDPITLADSSGEPLTVPPGRTWIELVPVDGTVELH